MIRVSKKFVKCKSGATSIEYALIAALIFLAIILGVTATGSSLNQSYSNTADQVQDATQ